MGLVWDWDSLGKVKERKKMDVLMNTESAVLVRIMPGLSGSR